MASRTSSSGWSFADRLRRWFRETPTAGRMLSAPSFWSSSCLEISSKTTRSISFFSSRVILALSFFVRVWAARGVSLSAAAAGAAARARARRAGGATRRRMAGPPGRVGVSASGVPAILARPLARRNGPSPEREGRRGPKLGRASFADRPARTYNRYVSTGAAARRPRLRVGRTGRRGRTLGGRQIVQIKVATRHGHLSEAHQVEIRAKAEKLLHFFDR